VAWQGGFVRELVVRLPGVGAGLVARVLDHPTLALVERLTFATARLPLFERGVLDAMVAAVRGSGPHRRLRAVTFAGLPVPPDELDAVREHLGRAAPRLERLEILPDLDPGSRQWLEIADRLDPIAPDSRPGPFSPAPGELRQPLDDADEEALWLDHGEWCDVREEESP